MDDVLCRGAAAARWRLLIAAMGLLVLLAAGCQRNLANAPCPCAAGWHCCERSQQCVTVLEASCELGDAGPSLADADRMVIMDASPDSNRPVESTGGSSGGGGNGGNGGLTGKGGGGGVDGSVGTGGGVFGGESTGGNGGGGGRGGSGGDSGSGGQAGGNMGGGPPVVDAGIERPVDAMPPVDARVGLDARVDAPVDAPVLPPPAPVCSPERWCWTNPMLTGEDFVQVWGAADNDVWVIGAGGAVLRWNGTRWAPVGSPVASSLSALWGIAAHDVWVGGNEGLWHWNGVQWTATPLDASPAGGPAIAGIWGDASNDVWAVGNGIWRWNGTRWLPAGAPTDVQPYVAIWGSSKDDVWAAGSTSSLPTPRWMIHWDGRGWTPFAGVDRRVDHIRGTGPNDIWASTKVGDQLFHWNGTVWTAQAPGGGRGVFTVGGKNTVWALEGALNLRRWNGTAWSPGTGPAPSTLTAIWGSSPQNIFGVGEGGLIARWNDTGWATMQPTVSATQESVGIVKGTSSNDVWTSTGSQLLHWDGNAWSLMKTYPGNNRGYVRELFAAGPRDLWVATGDELQRWNGFSWAPANPVPVVAPQSLGMIAGSGSNDVWVEYGPDVLHHWSGNGWSKVPIPAAALPLLVEMWSSGPRDLWLSGGPAGVTRWNGATWSPLFQAPLGGVVFEITGSGATDVWALSRRSAPDTESATDVLRWTGAGWAISRTFPHDVRSLSVSKPNDAWAVATVEPGTNPRVLHWDGNVWSTVLSPIGFHALWAGADGVVWAGGARGSILRRAP